MGRMNSKLHPGVLAMLILLTLLASACGPPPMPTAAPCDAFPFFAPHDLAFDRDGNLWAASTEGAWRLDPTGGTCALFTEENGLAEEYLNAVAVGPDGDVWFGGYRKGDISRFDGRRWTAYTRAMDCSAMLCWPSLWPPTAPSGPV